MAETPGGFAALFGKGSVFEQLFVWQVLAQVISAIGEPGLAALQQLVMSKAPVTPLTVADAVDAVVKSHTSADAGAAEASLSGVSRERFDLLLAAAGEPPGLQFLLEAWRRGFIPLEGEGAQSVSVEQGVRESRTLNKWIPVIRSMSQVPIGVADAVDAVVEGQISHAQGETIAYANGIGKDDFQILVNTRGNPPSPSELNELLRRGLIPLEGTGPDVTSVQQGIFEGATKDKWWRMFAALSEYVPPPRTVTALVGEGAITDEVGLKLLRNSGLPPELAAAYITAAHHARTKAHRDLAESQVVTLYRDRIIDRAQATAMLEALTFTAQDVDFVLAMTDFEVDQSALRAALGRVHAVFVNHRISVSEASAAVDALQVPADARDQLLSTWQLEAATNVKILTPAEIVDLVHLDMISPDDGVTMLQALGYSQQDGRWLVTIKLKRNPWAPAPPGGPGT